MSEFRNPEQGARMFRLRVVAAALFMLACLLLLVWRLHHLQVEQYDYFHSRAEGNRIAVLPVPPRRGTIHDRNGEELARNYSAWTVEINPAQVRSIDRTLDALAEVLPFDERDRRRFRRMLTESKHFDSVPV